LEEIEVERSEIGLTSDECQVNYDVNICPTAFEIGLLIKATNAAHRYSIIIIITIVVSTVSPQYASS
jgi:6,7-dimethyl-8-ribityllumazine synthase